VIVQGNLSVTGTLTYLNAGSTTTDNLLWIAANNAASAAAASGGGLAVGPAPGPYYATWVFDNSSSAWKSSLPIIATGGANINGALTGATTGTFSGNVSAGNVNGGNLVSGTYLQGTLTTAAQPNITSVGTLTSLNVNGIITGTSLVSNVATGTAPLTVSSTTKVANLNVEFLDGYDTSVATVASTVVVRDPTGNISGSYFVGNGSLLTGVIAATAATVTTAAQPNITSVGTLTSVAVSGVTNLNSVGNVIITGGTNGQVLTTDGSGSLSWTTVSGGGGSYANSNVATYLASGTVSTNITTTANVSGAYILGNGSSLSSLTGANVTGQVGNALVAGTVYTAAQPNITSVGTLTSLTVAGVIGIGSLNTTTITAGSSGTAGTITGDWTLTAGSTLQATYADLGERYSSDMQYESGTIVMIGGEREVTLATSDGRYRLAGIVSTNPAYVLNSTCADSVIIALAGRVPCKVVGPVRKGDLLTISDTNQGVACATASYLPGTIIGRALADYNKEGVGVIEVKVDRG
jgi:hypothetical protein